MKAYDRWLRWMAVRTLLTVVLLLVLIGLMVASTTAASPGGVPQLWL